MSSEINGFLNISNIVNMTMDHSYSVFGMIYSISMDSIKIFLKRITYYPFWPKIKIYVLCKLKKIQILIIVRIFFRICLLIY
ncbi:hypothetical protein QIA19_05010 (plasmid) [Borreliella finlandensis]|uniref:hypothetical protein n=1 Tax=Borreliella finlandensis TaxID=498741 RepID=UPI003AEF42DD